MLSTIDSSPESQLGAVRPSQPADFGIGRLFEHVRDAVVVVNAASGRIVLWNPMAETMFGYEAEDALGMPVSTLVPNSLQARHNAGLAHFAETGRGPLVDAHAVVEVPARHKSGDELMVELSLTPLDQTPLGERLVLAIVRDVTERTRLRQQSEQQLRDLRGLYQADEVLHRSLRLGDVLQGLVDLVIDMLGADAEHRADLGCPPRAAGTRGGAWLSG